MYMYTCTLYINVCLLRSFLHIAVMEQLCLVLLYGNTLPRCYRILPHWIKCQSIILDTITGLSGMFNRYALSLTDQYVLEKMNAFVPSIVDWCNEYMHSDPSPGRGGMEVRRFWNQSDYSKATVNVTVATVRDIEENVWCPR